MFRESIAVKQRLLDDGALVATVERIAEVLIDAFRRDHKLLACGNGGSASDAQHITAELSGRYLVDRPPLYAEALHVNTSYLTAVANDYSYQDIFSRAVRAFGRKGDVLLGLSTSGNSPNVLTAIEAAREIGMVTVGFTGETGGKMATMCDHIVRVPSRETARIQESHIMIGHAICEIVEAGLFGAKG
jgi:D-sedoheptulose 7-phosphate isomerase